MKAKDERLATRESHAAVIRAAPTQRAVYRCQRRSEPDDVVRRVRLRIDERDAGYPSDNREACSAFVNLLQRPREGQPVVWVSRGRHRLTLYESDMRSGGIAFVVTGLVYGARPEPVQTRG